MANQSELPSILQGFLLLASASEAVTISDSGPRLHRCAFLSKLNIARRLRQERAITLQYWGLGNEADALELGNGYPHGQAVKTCRAI